MFAEPCVFDKQSLLPWLVPPLNGCPKKGLLYSEVTEAFCRVPSTSFSQAPNYTLIIHLCRFRVRSYDGAISWKLFHSQFNPLRTNNLQSPSTTTRSRNINLVPIDYSFCSRLRGRLTLRGLTLRRNPWIFGDEVFHFVYRYLCQHSHF